MYRNYIEELHIAPDEVIVYLRKSRTDDPLLSVEEVLSKHETILDEWSEKNLLGKIPETNKFREIVSGETIADRPEVQKVLKLIESPKIKAILTVEVQRLSRGDLEDAGRLIKLIRYTNTVVLTPQKIYDLQDEFDRDSFERELKRGNEFLEYQKKIMNRGRLLSVSLGNYIGSVPPYGYDKIWISEGKRKCPMLSPNKIQAPVVQMIFDMYTNQNLGMPTICKQLDKMGIAPPKGEHWSNHSLKDMLSNVHYIGKVKWNWRKSVTKVEDSEVIKTRPKSLPADYLIYDGKHESLVSEDLFNATQEKLSKNPKVKKDYKLVNPFSGLLFCQCGRAMFLRDFNSKGIERCEPRFICYDQAHCRTGSCTKRELEASVTEILRQNIADFEIRIDNAQKDAVKHHEKLLKNLEKRFRDLENKEIAQWEAQANPDPEQRMPTNIFKKLNEKLVLEKDELKKVIAEVKRTAPDPVEYEEKLRKFREALDALNDPAKSAEQKNILLKACIERIEYKRNKPIRIKRNKKSVGMCEKADSPDRLKTGANWKSFPIEITVKLKS